MSIQIEVPFDALQRPGVAKALADLMVSLGGHTSADAVPTRAPAPAKPARARAAKPAPAPARPAPAPARPAPAPARPATSSSDEHWAAYFNALPEPSRRFLTLLKSRGKLTVDEAVSELGLKSSKAMGGLTGAMARWAPKHGIELPFEKSKDEDGKRFWTWTRS